MLSLELRRVPLDHPDAKYLIERVEEAQRRGLARRMLAHLESEVAEAGIPVITLGTGSRQLEALALYTQAGYVPIPGFGHYADSPTAHFLGKRLLEEPRYTLRSLSPETSGGW